MTKKFGGSGAFAVRSKRIVTPQGIIDGMLTVRDGRIEAVEAGAKAGNTLPVYDIDNLALMPGLVDTHVHVNEPGRTEWEGYETATRAAAAGGITTIVDMPLNCIPVTTSVAALQTKLAALAGKLSVDCGFYGGVVPGNSGELAGMIRAGVLGFKAFLVHSGIDDFPEVRSADLDLAMPLLAQAGVPLLVHAELDDGKTVPSKTHSLPEPYSRFLDSRPRAWENSAVEFMIEKCRATGCRTHIVHLSSAEAVPLLRAAKHRGLPISAETCPHYLSFAAEDIAAGDTRFKCAPPIRERANREALWSALRDDDIAFVVSDHSPCAPQLKHLEKGDFEAAWGGIAGLQFGLSAVWSGAAEHGFSLERLATWTATRPAALVGLSQRKGRLLAGHDADFVVFDPERQAPAGQRGIFHRHKVTPYEGRVMKGIVEASFLRGALVYERGSFPFPQLGQPLLGQTRG